MKITIFKNEYIVDINGNHICDSLGIAVRAEETTQCEVSEQNYERVVFLLKESRALLGLNFDGTKINDSTKKTITDEENGWVVPTTAQQNPHIPWFEPKVALEPELVNETPTEVPIQQEDSLVVKPIVTGEENGI